MCVLESPFTPALMSRRITAYTPNYILYAPYFKLANACRRIEKAVRIYSILVNILLVKSTPTTFENL